MGKEEIRKEMERREKQGAKEDSDTHKNGPQIGFSGAPGDRTLKRPLWGLAEAVKAQGLSATRTPRVLTTLIWDSAQGAAPEDTLFILVHVCVCTLIHTRPHEDIRAHIHQHTDI